MSECSSCPYNSRFCYHSSGTLFFYSRYSIGTFPPVDAVRSPSFSSMMIVSPDPTLPARISLPPVFPHIFADTASMALRRTSDRIRRHNVLLCRSRQLDMQIPIRKPSVDVFYEQIYDACNILSCQRSEHDNLIQTI